MSGCRVMTGKQAENSKSDWRWRSSVWTSCSPESNHRLTPEQRPEMKVWRKCSKSLMEENSFFFTSSLRWKLLIHSYHIFKPCFPLVTFTHANFSHLKTPWADPPSQITPHLQACPQKVPIKSYNQNCGQVHEIHPTCSCVISLTDRQ